MLTDSVGMDVFVEEVIVIPHRVKTKPGGDIYVE